MSEENMSMTRNGTVKAKCQTCNKEYWLFRGAREEEIVECCMCKKKKEDDEFHDTYQLASILRAR